VSGEEKLKALSDKNDPTLRRIGSDNEAVNLIMQYFLASTQGEKTSLADLDEMLANTNGNTIRSTITSLSCWRLISGDSDGYFLSDAARTFNLRLEQINELTNIRSNLGRMWIVHLRKRYGMRLQGSRTEKYLEAVTEMGLEYGYTKDELIDLLVATCDRVEQ
jgi:hypothetical protein